MTYPTADEELIAEIEESMLLSHGQVLYARYCKNNPSLTNGVGYPTWDELDSRTKKSWEAGRLSSDKEVFFG